MTKCTRFVGLDVHKETIAVAVADEDQQPRALGTIPNDPVSIARLMKRVGEGKRELSVCYEAGPTGYVICRQLRALKIDCVVVAPSLIPERAGDRVKTDRRDAEKLARLHRGGDLTPVWVPDEAHEALRELERARASAKKHEKRARSQLRSFLLRSGTKSPEGLRSTSCRYRAWLDTLRFENATRQSVFDDLVAEIDHSKQRVARFDQKLDAAVEAAPDSLKSVICALQAMRGMSTVTAVTIAAEIGEVGRFDRPRELMGYSGTVPSEHSSGNRKSRGGITKTGNAHLRRVLGEAAWHYRHRPRLGRALAKRQQGISSQVIDIAWKAQERLYKRYHRLAATKCKQKVVTAIAREMLGFIWAIGVHAEREAAKRKTLEQPTRSPTASSRPTTTTE